MSNKWLNSTVDAYKRYFGESANPVVYEVGSRDGKDGVELAERIFEDVPGDKMDYSNVVLFECNPPQIEVIKRDYPKATLMTFAAAGKDGHARFLSIDGGDNIAATGSSSMDVGRARIKPGNKSIIEVETRRLEPVIGELGHSEIDIMKIDAEGFTWEILKGLGSRLADIKVLHLETEMEGHHVTNKNSIQVFNFMRDNDFLCFAREYEWGGLEDQVWVNARLLRYA